MHYWHIIGKYSAAICNITAFLLIGSYASIAGEMLCGLIGILSYMKGIHYERRKCYKE